jgi:hypothetical protein
MESLTDSREPVKRGRPRLLRHATLAKHLPAILRAGLLCSKSRGKKPVVWACTPGKTPWACLHVVRRHGGKAQEVVVLELTAPRAWLKRHGGKTSGLWYSTRDINPGRIRGVITFGELSRSPAGEVNS